ncbi:MAG: DUF2797 domain-containing protein [Flavobacteriaceae bacterium]|nr:DUF2797 domain-containing protein [Flavobacteriaceae bacterium]
MKFNSVLRKMMVYNDETIQYYLVGDDDLLSVNQLIGSEIKIEYTANQCMACSKDVKLYRQGHCYNCFYRRPDVGDWIMRPELSKAHLGIEDRDLEYEKAVQLKPHIVYLAISSNMKVGVTRKTQVPTRWIDQGATKAIAIVEVPNRYLAGITEVALKDHYADKTNWRKMLKNEVSQEDILAEKQKVKDLLPEEVKQYFLEEDDLYELNYPVEKYPEKVKSHNFSKEKIYEGKLMGIKGQYLIFEDDTVINIRNNEGLVVNISRV